MLLWIFPGRADSHRVRTAAVSAALAALLALGLDQILNHIVNRPRAYVGHPVHLLLPKSLDNSFPSDHTAFAFAIVAGIWPVRRKIAIALGVVGVGLALARVIAGLHYPGDVLGGAAVGVISAVIVWFVARKPIGWITALGERVYDFVTRPVRRLAPRRT